MHCLLPRHPRNITKRGQILLVFGFIWVTIGFSVYQQPVIPGGDHLLFSMIPTTIRAWAWFLTGVTAMAYAFRPHAVGHDSLGFLALYIMPAERAAIFLLGWLDYHMTSVGGPGYSRGLFGASVYLAIVAAVMICASWPDPPATTIEGPQ